MVFSVKSHNSRPDVEVETHKSFSHSLFIGAMTILHFALRVPIVVHHLAEVGLHYFMPRNGLIHMASDISHGIRASVHVGQRRCTERSQHSLRSLSHLDTA
jgi:hypothetical protein